MDPEGPLPAHIMGNMWAQKWSALADIIKPYPNKPDLSVTDEMVRQGWTPKIMFEKAEAFFVSIGFPRLLEVDITAKYILLLGL